MGKFADFQEENRHIIREPPKAQIPSSYRIETTNRGHYGFDIKSAVMPTEIECPPPVVHKRDYKDLNMIRREKKEYAIPENYRRPGATPLTSYKAAHSGDKFKIEKLTEHPKKELPPPKKELTPQNKVYITHHQVKKNPEAVSLQDKLKVAHQLKSRGHSTIPNIDKTSCQNDSVTKVADLIKSQQSEHFKTQDEIDIPTEIFTEKKLSIEQIKEMKRERYRRNSVRIENNFVDLTKINPPVDMELDSGEISKARAYDNLRKQKLNKYRSLAFVDRPEDTAKLSQMEIIKFKAKENRNALAMAASQIEMQNDTAISISPTLIPSNSFVRVSSSVDDLKSSRNRFQEQQATEALQAARSNQVKRTERFKEEKRIQRQRSPSPSPRMRLQNHKSLKEKQYEIKRVNSTVPYGCQKMKPCSKPDGDSQDTDSKATYSVWGLAKHYAFYGYSQQEKESSVDKEHVILPDTKEVLVVKEPSPHTNVRSSSWNLGLLSPLTWMRGSQTNETVGEKQQESILKKNNTKKTLLESRNHGDDCDTQQYSSRSTDIAKIASSPSVTRLSGNSQPSSQLKHVGYEPERPQAVYDPECQTHKLSGTGTCKSCSQTEVKRCPSATTSCPKGSIPLGKSPFMPTEMKKESSFKRSLNVEKVREKEKSVSLNNAPQKISSVSWRERISQLFNSNNSRVTQTKNSQPNEENVPEKKLTSSSSPVTKRRYPNEEKQKKLKEAHKLSQRHAENKRRREKKHDTKPTETASGAEKQKKITTRSSRKYKKQPEADFDPSELKERNTNRRDTPSPGTSFASVTLFLQPFSRYESPSPEHKMKTKGKNILKSHAEYLNIDETEDESQDEENEPDKESGLKPGDQKINANLKKNRTVKNKSCNDSRITMSDKPFEGIDNSFAAKKITNTYGNNLPSQNNVKKLKIDKKTSENNEEKQEKELLKDNEDLTLVNNSFVKGQMEKRRNWLYNNKQKKTPELNESDVTKSKAATKISNSDKVIVENDNGKYISENGNKNPKQENEQMQGNEKKEFQCREDNSKNENKKESVDTNNDNTLNQEKDTLLDSAEYLGKKESKENSKPTKKPLCFSSPKRRKSLKKYKNETIDSPKYKSKVQKSKSSEKIENDATKGLLSGKRSPIKLSDFGISSKEKPTNLSMLKHVNGIQKIHLQADKDNLYGKIDMKEEIEKSEENNQDLANENQDKKIMCVKTKRNKYLSPKKAFIDSSLKTVEENSLDMPDKQNTENAAARSDRKENNQNANKSRRTERLRNQQIMFSKKISDFLEETKATKQQNTYKRNILYKEMQSKPDETKKVPKIDRLVATQKSKTDEPQKVQKVYLCENTLEQGTQHEDESRQESNEEFAEYITESLGKDVHNDAHSNVIRNFLIHGEESSVISSYLDSKDNCQQPHNNTVQCISNKNLNQTQCQDSHDGSKTCQRDNQHRQNKSLVPAENTHRHSCMLPDSISYTTKSSVSDTSTTANSSYIYKSSPFKQKSPTKKEVCKKETSFNQKQKYLKNKNSSPFQKEKNWIKKSQSPTEKYMSKPYENLKRKDSYFVKPKKEWTEKVEMNAKYDIKSINNTREKSKLSYYKVCSVDSQLSKSSQLLSSNQGFQSQKSNYRKYDSKYKQGPVIAKAESPRHKSHNKTHKEYKVTNCNWIPTENEITTLNGRDHSSTLMSFAIPTREISSQCYPSQQDFSSNSSSDSPAISSYIDRARAMRKDAKRLQKHNISKSGSYTNITTSTPTSKGTHKSKTTGKLSNNGCPFGKCNNIQPSSSDSSLTASSQSGVNIREFSPKHSILSKKKVGYIKNSVQNENKGETFKHKGNNSFGEGLISRVDSFIDNSHPSVKTVNCNQQIYKAHDVEIVTYIDYPQERGSAITKAANNDEFQPYSNYINQKKQEQDECEQSVKTSVFSHSSFCAPINEFDSEGPRFLNNQIIVPHKAIGKGRLTSANITNCERDLITSFGNQNFNFRDNSQNHENLFFPKHDSDSCDTWMNNADERDICKSENASKCNTNQASNDDVNKKETERPKSSFKNMITGLRIAGIFENFAKFCKNNPSGNLLNEANFTPTSEAEVKKIESSEYFSKVSLSHTSQSLSSDSNFEDINDSFRAVMSGTRLSECNPIDTDLDHLVYVSRTNQTDDEESAKFKDDSMILRTIQEKSNAGVVASNSSVYFKDRACNPLEDSTDASDLETDDNYFNEHQTFNSVVNFVDMIQEADRVTSEIDERDAMDISCMKATETNSENEVFVACTDNDSEKRVNDIAEKETSKNIISSPIYFETDNFVDANCI